MSSWPSVPFGASGCKLYKRKNRITMFKKHAAWVTDPVREENGERYGKDDYFVL